MKQVIDNVTLDMVNQYAKSLPKEENVVLAVMMPQKEGLRVPTKEEILGIYTSALNEEVEAFKETVSNEPLLSSVPLQVK